MISAQRFTTLQGVVMLIVAAVVAVVSISSISVSSEVDRDAVRRGDAVAAGQAFEQYFTEEGEYKSDCSIMRDAYLKEGFPSDPAVMRSDFVESCEADNYCLCVRMEREDIGNSVDSNCSQGAGDWFCVSSEIK